MNYLRIKNWEKFQHQSNKPLPWIKFFTALLAPTKDPDLSLLPDHTRLLLYHIWLMARVFDGRIPETWLNREKLNVKSRICLDPLLELGYIWFEDEHSVRIEVKLSRSRARDARLNSKSLTLGIRESKKEKSKSLVENFVLEPKHRDWAAKNAPSVPVDVELEAWKDRLRSNEYTSGRSPGIPVASAQASFYTSMRNAENWGIYKKPGNGRSHGVGLLLDETRKQSADALFAECWGSVPLKEGEVAARAWFDSRIAEIISGGGGDDELESFAANLVAGVRGFVKKITDERTEPRYIMKGSNLFLNHADYIDYKPLKRAPEPRRPEGPQGVVI